MRWMLVILTNAGDTKERDVFWLRCLHEWLLPHHSGNTTSWRAEKAWNLDFRTDYLTQERRWHVSKRVRIAGEWVDEYD
jgi:Mn-dependent DtxR family transcriptional regulator